MNDLKPCPSLWCGSSRVEIKTCGDTANPEYYPICNDCDESPTLSFRTKNEAVTAWNTRPNEINWPPVSEEPEFLPGFDVTAYMYDPNDEPHVHYRVFATRRAWLAEIRNYGYTHWTDHIPGPPR